jgi:AcrR family transcriptional regulator
LPYPTQLHPELIVETAAEMVEREGEEHVSLAKLAAALGVRAPSLYRYFDGRAVLLRAVNTRTLERLFVILNETLQPGSSGADPLERFLTLTAAYHDFALANPRAYQLAMVNASDETRPDEDLLLRMVLPLQASIAAFSGEANSLTALRGALALVHGYVMLELNQQMRRGGDLRAAFFETVRAYLRGWQSEQRVEEA